MSLKKAAEELLKVADELEVEANSVTEFVCDKCNHTATLAEINDRRREAAEKVEGNVEVEAVTVNDTISCPACDGVMSYRPNETSARFYFEPEKTAQDEEDDEEKEEKAASVSINYDSLDKYLAK